VKFSLNKKKAYNPKTIIPYMDIILIVVVVVVVKANKEEKPSNSHQLKLQNCIFVFALDINIFKFIRENTLFL
jgi:cytochrome c biogenesis factor